MRLLSLYKGRALDIADIDFHKAFDKAYVLTKYTYRQIGEMCGIDG